LTQLLPTLVREAGASRIELRPLQEPALREIVRDRYELSDEAMGRLVDRLSHFAEGNPFYVREMLRDLEEERVLRPGERRWTLGNLDRTSVPSLVQQVLEARIDRLGEVTRDRLAVAAVIGQEIPLALWQGVTEAAEDDLILTIERASEARLLDVRDDGAHVSFAHALVREALYVGILPPRRRGLHRRVADQLIASRSPDPDAVAYHLQEAGDGRAIEWLVRAGERARQEYAWVTAKERFASAIALLGGDPERDRDRGWLLYRTGRLLRFGDTAAGIDYLVEAERIARDHQDPILAAYALFDLGTFRWLAVQVEHGIGPMEVGADAIDALPADHLQSRPELVDWIADARAERSVSTTPVPMRRTSRRGSLSLALAYAGRFSEAHETAVAFLDEAATVSRSDALVLSGTCDCKFSLALVEAAMGRPVEARVLLRQAREDSKLIDHRFMVALNLSDELREVVLPFHTTDLSMRRSLLAEATMEWTRAVGALPSDLAARLHELDLLLLEGRWDEAAQIARPFSGSSLPFNREYAVLALISLARWQGEFEVASALIESWLPNGPATQPGGHRYRFATGLQRHACDLALDRGDLAAAEIWLEVLDSWREWSGAKQGKAEILIRKARLYLLAGKRDQARITVSEAVSLGHEPRQPLVLLAAYRLLGEIETSSADGKTAAESLDMALRLAESCAAPFERLLTQIARAELHVSEGAQASAGQLLREIRPLAEALKVHPTILRIDALLTRLPQAKRTGFGTSSLSIREREVLKLVAAGRTNPEIARELFISERTVTTHLTHIFEKLSVTARAQAVEVAVRNSLI
jgi:DNA-binding CsgD family transcriptional regulator